MSFTLSPNEIINYSRYPIDQPGNPDRQAVIDQVKSELADDGCAVIRNFLSDQGLEALLNEALSDPDAEVAFEVKRGVTRPVWEPDDGTHRLLAIAEDLAKRIAYEQTVELPQSVVDDPNVLAHVVGRVHAITRCDETKPERDEDRATDGVAAHWVEIDFASALANGQLSQLLHLVFGNVSLSPGVRLSSLTLPQNVLASFAGRAARAVLFGVSPTDVPSLVGAFTAITALTARDGVDVSPAILTFTAANWNTPQFVTVTGVDDTVGDGDQSITVTVSVDDSL